MAKRVFPTQARKIIFIVRANLDKRIYLTYETWSNMKRYSNEIPEEYRFLTSSNGYVIDGYRCLRLECINCYGDKGEDNIYFFPDRGDELLL